MTTPTVAFIGAGNMASSIIGGLLAGGFPPKQISAADPYRPSLDKLENYGITQLSDRNADIINHADVVVLAVKPQTMRDVAQDVAPALGANKPLVISIAAGITTGSLRSWLGEDYPVVRCMPNTPALLGCGATGLYASDDVDSTQREYANTIMGATGYCCWVEDESQLDTITALSGSGPAYFFLLVEAMINSATQMGLSPELAHKLANQTALGAARMVCESDVDAAELRKRVTSPNGTTERAIDVFLSQQLPNTVDSAMQAAAIRARELAQELG